MQLLGEPRENCLPLIVLLLAWIALPSLPASADPGPILAGIDLLQTPPGTFVDFSGSPIPADFFGPGSDPFTGTVNLVGAPLVQSAGPPIGNADTIVLRQPAPLVCGDPPVMIDIELVALSLAGTGPITVTSNGGMNPESWDVQVCISSLVPSVGTMTIAHECLDGGTFSSVLDVVPRFVFTRAGDGAIRVLDPGDRKQFTASGDWVHGPMQIPALAAGPGVQVDGNCDGAPDMPLALGTSNFFPGIEPIPCNSCTPSTDVAKAVQPIPHMAPNSEHTVRPVLVPPPVVAVPTLSGWGLAIAALLLVAAGVLMVSRRRFARQDPR